ncbi:MAG TPA: GlxA family transcriptional regulator [Burkholderiaceae bacterium]|nr:GlxA family transcriptional regulator [Burkholderiaceae bacterium]
MSRLAISDCTHFGFVLLPSFTLLSFSSAVEVLRMANHLSGTQTYRWSMLHPDRDHVVASNGISVTARPLDPLDIPDIVFVCGGIDVKAACDPQTLSMLRMLAARGVLLGSLCTGAYALARAGLLNGYRCSTHWENLTALRQEFPSVGFEEEVFVVDRNRVTCTGGAAPLDMMLHLISPKVGRDIRSSIASQFIVAHIRDARDRQRVPLSARVGTVRETLMEVATLMEANIEEPLSLGELAQLSHSSQRQIQRMFRDHLGVTPTQYYLNLRLQRARELLTQTGLSVMNITVACGFQSACHFSKTYRKLFGVTPSSERGWRFPHTKSLYQNSSSSCLAQ